MWGRTRRMRKPRCSKAIGVFWFDPGPSAGEAYLLRGEEGGCVDSSLELYGVAWLACGWEGGRPHRKPRAGRPRVSSNMRVVPLAALLHCKVPLQSPVVHFRACETPPPLDDVDIFDYDGSELLSDDGGVRKLVLREARTSTPFLDLSWPSLTFHGRA